VRYFTTRGLRDHRVEHSNHGPAKLGTQINMLFSSKLFQNVDHEISTSRAATLAFGVQSNTACEHGIYLQMTQQYCLS
jgi:hypothetical protein